MALQQRIIVGMMTLVLGLGAMAAEKLTPPQESLNGLRPGSLTLADVQKQMGKKPDVTNDGGLLHLYGGPEQSSLYGWFMIENPNYTVPDLAVETPKGSDRVDLVMAIGYDGLKTEKGITCFASEDDLIQAYGKPDFAFAVPMQGYVLYELYYPKLGISFDLAAMGASTQRQVIAIYVTYPENLQRAIDLRKQYIEQGVGKDVTMVYDGSVAA